MKCKQPLPITAKSWPFKDRCSRCRARRKRPITDPPHTIDHHWCDQCYITAPVQLRSRRASRKVKRLLREKQEARAAAIQKERKEALEARLAQQAKNGKATQPSRKTSKRKTDDQPHTLALTYAGNSGSNQQPQEAEIAESSYDVLQKRIAKVRDKTIFEEDAATFEED